MKKQKIELIFILFLIIIMAYLTGFASDAFFSLNIFTEDCDKNFVIEGKSDNITVYNCQKSKISDVHYPKAEAYASLNGHIIKNLEHNKINRNLLMHELGHNLGFLHSQKKNIMNHNRDMRLSPERNLTNSAIKIAETFEGFKYINWSLKKHRDYIKNEIKKDNLEGISEFVVENNLEEFKNKGCSGIYYTKDVSWSNKTYYPKDFYIYCGKI